MDTRPYTIIRKMLHAIVLLGIAISALGMQGKPAVHAQDSQPMAILTTNNVESLVPPAIIGNIGTSFATATWLGITGSSYDPGQGIHGEATGSDNHYYVFKILSTGSKTFRIYEHGYTNQYLELFDSYQTLRATGIEECVWGPTLYCYDKLTYNFTSTGIYFLRVHNGNLTLNYDLTWDYDGSSSNKSLFVNWLIPGIPYIYQNPIEGFNDIRTYDWYYPSLARGQYYRVWLDGASGSNFDIDVYDQNNLSTPLASATSSTYPDAVEFTNFGTFIRVYRNSGTGSYRLSVLAIPPPGAPTNLTASVVSSSQINLSWTDNSSDETDFRIERSLNGSTDWILTEIGDYTEIGTSAANSTGYSSTDLSACTAYYYRVRAYRSGGGAYSSYSKIASNTTSAKTSGCPLNAPSGLTATPISGSQINLNWTDNSSNETNFRVERSQEGSTGWTEIGTSTANSPSYSSTSLSDCTTYYYRVRIYRFSDDVYSSYSNTASTSSSGCSLNAPSGLTATSNSDSQIDLSWTDNSSYETDVRVERSPDGSTGWTEIGTSAAYSRKYSNTGLSACTTYYYRVRVYRFNNNKDGVYSSYSNTASAIRSGCLLHAPDHLTATPILDSQIDLSWTDNSSNETGFRVERSPDGSTGWTEIDKASANSTSYSSTGLSACTIYYYRVRAYSSSVHVYSSYSNIAHTMTWGCTR